MAGERDVVARVLATGAVVIGGALAVNEVVNRDPVDPKFDPNLVGDCLHENILREAFGYPEVSYEQCKAERERWADGMSDDGYFAPPPAPKPGSGG